MTDYVTPVAYPYGGQAPAFHNYGSGSTATRSFHGFKVSNRSEMTPVKSLVLKVYCHRVPEPPIHGREEEIGERTWLHIDHKDDQSR